MPAGLQVFNDYGSILIDDTNFNLALRSKDVVTPGPAGPPYTAFVSKASTVIPLFAYKVVSTTLPTQMISRTFSAGTTVCRVGSSSSGFGDVTFYCFDLPVDPGIAQQGLQVFKADGSLTFDSRLQHPVIAAAVPVPNTTPIVVNLPAGRTYAMMSDAINCVMNGNVFTISPQPVDVGRVILIVDVTGY